MDMNITIAIHMLNEIIQPTDAIVVQFRNDNIPLATLVASAKDNGTPDLPGNASPVHFNGCHKSTIEGNHDNRTPKEQSWPQNSKR
jgi:hypothetical protein